MLQLRRSEPGLRSGRVGSHRAFAPDDQTLVLRREPDEPGAPVLWVAVRTRGPGRVELAKLGGTGGRWETVLTSDDPCYSAGDFLTTGGVVVTIEDGSPVVRFTGPSAVVFRQHPEP